MYLQQIPNNDIKQIVKAGTYLASTSVSNRPESLGWWYITAIKVQGNVLALTARDTNYMKVYSGILDHDDNDTLEWSRCDNFGYNSLSDLANALGESTSWIGTKFDSYTTAGTYWVTGDLCEVFVSSNGRICQRLTSCSSTGKIMCVARVQEGGVWKSPAKLSLLYSV